MRQILLCSSNPMLIKLLYGVLRDEGFVVETVEHPSLAVRKVLGARYGCAVIDSDPFGMRADDAARVIRSVAPDLPVILMGDHGLGGGGGGDPLNIETIRRAIRDLAHEEIP